MTLASEITFLWKMWAVVGNWWQKRSRVRAWSNFYPRYGGLPAARMRLQAANNGTRPATLTALVGITENGDSHVKRVGESGKGVKLGESEICLQDLDTLNDFCFLFGRDGTRLC